MARMIPMGPMTIIVLLVIAVCIVVGIGILVRAGTGRTSGRRHEICSQCRTRNPHHAEYCSQCGRRLDAA